MRLNKASNLINYIKDSRFIDHKDEILESLENNEWNIKSINSFPWLGDVVDIEDDKGYHLTNIPLYIFNDKSFIKILITEYIKIKNNDKIKKK